MKSSLAWILLFTRLCAASAELVFEQRTESQSLQLSCCPPQQAGSPTGLHLYRRGARSQTTLLSMAEGGGVRVDPGHRGRLQLRGGLDPPQVNVTVSRLQPGDSGLYVWELSYRETDSDQVLLRTTKLFLLVEKAGGSCRCSHGYVPLLLIISTAAGLLLLTLCWAATDRCAKARRRHKPQLALPIYEEMTRKQQSAAAVAQNNQEAPAHLEEVDFPVYANPNIRQPQDNYYACPRQLALRA